MRQAEEKKADDYFSYLDHLRETGVTNMFAAAPYLRREFGLSLDQGREILTKWMKGR